MQSPNKKLHVTDTQDAPEGQIFSEVWLSLATAPFLLGVLGLQAISKSLLALGQASEEVFRGDRLPVLHLPTQEPTSSPEPKNP